MNPLLNEYGTLFNSVPFSKISLGHFQEAIPQAISIAKKEIEEIVNTDAAPTFKNTIEALEASGKMLGQIATIFFNLNSAETSTEMQHIAQQISPLLTEYGNDILLNEKLFSRINEVWKNKDKEVLNEEQKTLLEKTYKRFVRNGAHINEEDKQKLREIDKRLSQISLAFGENVLKATNQYSMHITDVSKLKGIPESVLNMAREEARARELEGWLFTLQYPSYVPFMKYCADRDLREQMSKAFGSKCFVEGELNNQKNVLEIASLRNKRAELLGYKTHAQFVLEERMAKKPEQVNQFLKDLLHKAKPVAEKEKKELEELAIKDGIKEMQTWDHAYYEEKLRKAKFDLSEEQLKEFFPLDQVLKGAFQVSEKLYGLKYKKIDRIDTYHPEVDVYEVLDKNGKHLALLYTDFFPRPGKRAGAWMTAYRGQYKNKNEEQRPHVSIVCNFSRPSGDKPSLLTFDEVRTLFHEFGHALHGILADTQYESLSGTHVLWDFVELPSQFMENYCFEEEVLNLFAKHYKTGEPLPKDWIKSLSTSSHFMGGYKTIRQVGLALLDMAWHNDFKEESGQVKQIEEKALEETNLYPKNEQTNTSCSFSHIFQGGYSAGYYSYKWAEVLDADAYEYFKEKGIFNYEIAKKIKLLLQAGGTINPMDLYIKFRGKEPSKEALVKRLGIENA